MKSPLATHRRFPATLFALVACALGSSSAQTFNPIQVPLTVVSVSDGSGGFENKVGLWAYVGSGTNAAAKFYQLDTGSSGFFAEYAPTPNSGVAQWWGDDVVQNHVTGTASYGSKVSLNFDVVTASVTLSNSLGQRLVTTGSIQIGQVQTATNPSDWQTVTQAGQPALHSIFYGNFGADIYPHTTGSSTTNLFTALGQIPNAQGFVVHIGNIDHPDPDAPPTLTVGITAAMRAEFPYATPLVPNADGALFPITGYAASEEYNIHASYQISDQDTTQTFDDISTLLDTGGPSTSFRESVDHSFLDGDKLKPGLNFSMIFPSANGSAPFVITYSTGTDQSLNLVAIGTSTENNVNAGLNPYAYADIMFDLEDGVMRFKPIPEPTPLAAAAALLLFLAGKYAVRKPSRP